MTFNILFQNNGLQLFWEGRPYAQLQLSEVSEVQRSNIDRVEVRTLGRAVKFIHTKLGQHVLQNFKRPFPEPLTRKFEARC